MVRTAFAAIWAPCVGAASVPVAGVQRKRCARSVQFLARNLPAVHAGPQPESDMLLYQAYQSHSDTLSPLRMFAQHQGALFWLNGTEGSPLRRAAAAMEVFSRMRLTHARPAYGITSVKV